MIVENKDKFSFAIERLYKSYNTMMRDIQDIKAMYQSNKISSYEYKQGIKAIEEEMSLLLSKFQVFEKLYGIPFLNEKKNGLNLSYEEYKKNEESIISHVDERLINIEKLILNSFKEINIKKQQGMPVENLKNDVAELKGYCQVLQLIANHLHGIGIEYKPEVFDVISGLGSNKQSGRKN